MGDFDQEISSLLEHFGFSYLANQSIGSVSGGELKIIQLLSELLLNRPFFIMDDPFSGLDSLRKRTVKDMVRSIMLDELTGLNRLDHLIVTLPDSQQTDCDSLADFITDKVEISVSEDDSISHDLNEFTDILSTGFERQRSESILISGLGVKINRQKRTLFENSQILFESGKLNIIDCPNGTGKTLLLNLVVGYCPKEVEVASGKILFEGMDRSREIKRWVSSRESSVMRSKILYVPQYCDYLFAAHTPRELYNQISKSLDAKGIFKPVPEEVINALFDERKMIEHSIGEGRFLTFLFAMMIALCDDNVSWVILDEPDSYLDRRFQKYLVIIIQLVISAGINVVVTSHNLFIYDNVSQRNVIRF